MVITINAQQYIENTFSINREEINLYEFTPNKEKLEGTFYEHEKMDRDFSFVSGRLWKVERR